MPIAPNLLERCFTPRQIGGLNRALCGDITYVATAQGWLYLATVQDLYSRRILGWDLGQSLEAELVQKAFERAMQTRQSNRVASMTCQASFKLFHSDRGSQYASRLFKNALKKHGFVASMSRKGGRPLGRIGIMRPGTRSRVGRAFLALIKVSWLSSNRVVAL